MMSRIFLASGATIAVTAETGPMEMIKNILLILFLVVGAVWLLIDARRNLVATYGGAVQPAPHTGAAPIAACTAPRGQPAPEIVAIIAAAVHAHLGRASRIVAISTDDDAQTWAAEGRRAIYATRKVR